MEVDIKLFATLKDRAGSNRIRVNLPEPATVATLLDAVRAEYPSLVAALGSSLVSVNRSFAAPETPVRGGDEVALFPPVSGGQGRPSGGQGRPSGGQGQPNGGDALPYPTYFAVTNDEIDIAAIQRHLLSPEIGAVVTFTGYVRGRTERDGLPPETLHLEYEAYSEMAEEKMAQIAREIWQRWPLVQGVALVQRIGQLPISDVTTFVACAGAHRDQGAFEAARYGIDRLKEIVPVWKKEVGADRSLWLEGHYRPTVEDNDSAAANSLSE